MARTGKTKDTPAKPGLGTKIARGWSDFVEAVWLAVGSERTVLYLIGIYCLAHLVIRMVLSPVFSLDEAEQVLFSQSIEWGYRFRHPPLITWLTWGVFEVTGVQRPTLFLMKYAIMVGGLFAHYFAAKRILGDVRLACLAVFAMMATYTLGYYPHVDLMHTVLLTAMLSTGILLLARILQEGRWSDYLLYGLVTALGILSKYVYGVFPLAVLVTLAFVPMFRARIAWLRMGASLAATLALLVPYVAWALAFEYSITGLAQDMTGAESAGFSLTDRLTGTVSLLVSLLEFTLPASLLAALFFWRTWLPGSAKASPSPADQPMAPADWARLLEGVMILGAGFMWLAVLVLGAAEFKGRWMHQVLMGLSIYLFLRLLIAAKLQGTSWSERFGGAARGFMVAIAAVVALAFIARPVSYALYSQSCGKCWAYENFDRYTQGLYKDGFRGGTIVVKNMYTGGNLRLYFPESRVLIHDYPLSIFPGIGEQVDDPRSPAQGQCLLAWLGDKGEIPRKMRPLLEELGVDPERADAQRGRITARYHTTGTWLGERRMGQLSYVLYPMGNGDCR